MAAAARFMHTWALMQNFSELSPLQSCVLSLASVWLRCLIELIIYIDLL